MELLERFVEMQNILDVYGKQIIEINGKKGGDWRKEMIISIRPHLPPEKLKIADFMISYMNMQEMMEKMRFMQSFMEASKA